MPSGVHVNPSRRLLVAKNDLHLTFPLHIPESVVVEGPLRGTLTALFIAGQPSDSGLTGTTTSSAVDGFVVPDSLQGLVDPDGIVGDAGDC